MKKEELIQKNIDQYIEDTRLPFYYTDYKRPINPAHHTVWFNKKTGELEHYSKISGWTISKYV